MIFYKYDFKGEDEYKLSVASTKYIPNLYVMDNNVCYKDKNNYIIIRKDSVRIEKNGLEISVNQFLKEKNKQLIKYIKLQVMPTQKE